MQANSVNANDYYSADVTFPKNKKESNKEIIRASIKFENIKRI